MIQNISIDKLYSHLNNPRKDLGDLSELVESIKAQGILQNLTIVPRKDSRCSTCNLYIGGVGKCSEGFDKELTALIHAPKNNDSEHIPCPKWEWREAYTVIIGHRRLAAAKLAGLTEVPCAIVDMTPQEQIATMLLENIQRSDLTVYEQACGIQMMLDLGETVANISEKTGFSETTVRRRVKLLELDQDKFKASVERGATLMDFAELEKIQDINLRNKVLEKIGTANFKWELQSAIDKEKAEANSIIIVAELEKFAKKTTNTNNLQYVRGYFPSQGSTVEIPDDADTEEYFYTATGKYFYLYKKREAQEVDPAETERRKKEQERRDAFTDIAKKAYQLRFEFAKEVSNAKVKKNMAAVIKLAIHAMIRYDGPDFEELTEILGLEVDEESEDTEIQIISDSIDAQPERLLFLSAYLGMDSSGQDYHTWDRKYRSNETLDIIYSLLEKLGYEMSDEEKSLQDGTHELFANSEV